MAAEPVVICPGCGEENPARFSLCGYCGTPLARATPRPEVRRTVTVVFSDLKGSTELAERVDSESVRELLNRYFDEMRQVLERHGGVVEKYIGDAIMAVFGLPRVREDDALRAVRATADMQRALIELNAELDATWGVRLANRIGVNTGEVVAGDAAGGQRLVTGDPVNVAARLEQAAGEMQVLIGEPTYRLVRHRADVEPIEPLALKGKSEPVPAYRLLAVHETDRSMAEVRETQVVGRALEAARLIQEFELAVSTRSCGLVTILGEAGIGKSRLIEEFCRMVGAEARVLRGRCLAYGRGITFWPLVEVVRQAAGIGDEDIPATARAKLAAALGDGGEAAADRLAAAIGLAERQFPVEEIFWGARKLFEHLARQRPLVVVVEDVHWAESAMLDLIDRVVASTTNAPVLLLCAARTEFAERRPQWRERGDGVITLEPLSGEQTAAILDNLLGDADLDLAARRAVVAAADGNPFFAEQLLSMLIEDGDLRREDGRWVRTRDLTTLALPPTLHALLSARLDLLSGDERGVIEPASVIGGVFEVSAVEALAAEPVRDALPSHLRSLEGKQLIAAEGPPVPDRDLAFRFHHILIRDAAYRGLLKRTRAALHERFADWLEAVSGERDREVEFEEILGYHLEQAHRYLTELGPLDDRGRALGVRAATRLGAAGRRAFSRSDMPAAANLLRRAATLLPIEHPTRLGLLPVLGEALMEIGEFPWAIVFLDEAVELSRDQPRLNADLVLTRLLVRHHVAENLERWREEASREAERLIPVLQEEHADAQLAKAWRLLGFVHGSVCRYGDAARAVREAAKHARQANDARLEARNISAYTLAALYGPTPAAEAIEQCEELAAQGLTDRQAEALVLCSLAQLRAMQGDIPRARDLLRTARTLLDDLGVIVLAAATAMHQARIELLGGDLETAETELRRAYDTLTRLGERYLLPPLAALLAHVVYARGRADESEEISRTAEELTAADDVEAQALWRSVRAKVLSGRDLAGEAESMAREAVRLIRTTDAPGMQADALLDLAEVLRRSARLDEARVVADEARRLYQDKGSLVGAARAAAVLTALPEQVG
jgi:predicted ATPase/class 3 adenylate cyclase